MLGNYAAAEPLLRQALEIIRKALGEEHPDYAQSLNNLAMLYRMLGNYAAAEPLLRQASEIRRKALGEKHPDYATSLNNLAVPYQDMGNCAAAEPLYRQASVILRQVLGGEHPDYATDYREYLARQGVYSIMFRPHVMVLARDQGFAPLGWLFAFKTHAKNVIAQVLPEP